MKLKKAFWIPLLCLCPAAVFCLAVYDLNRFDVPSAADLFREAPSRADSVPPDAMRSAVAAYGCRDAGYRGNGIYECDLTIRYVRKTGGDAFDRHTFLMQKQNGSWKRISKP